MTTKEVRVAIGICGWYEVPLSTSRRKFIRQASAATLAAFALPELAQEAVQHDGTAPYQARPVTEAGKQPKMLHSLELPPFVDALPLPEILRPAPPKHKGQPHALRVEMREVYAKVHRDVPPGRFWVYGTGPISPLIEARADEPLQIEWVNALPAKHFLPIDHSLHGCGHDVPEVRAVAHVHGAKVLPKDDGYPTDWFVPGTSRTCLYPLEQDAATLWYHDHAMGLNRLNVYAGMAGMFLIRDHAEDALQLPTGKYEVPLLLCDRDFTADGQLFYPTSGDPEHPWVPEFVADAILVNGKVRPYFEVEPRLYRFRVLNMANSRAFPLSLTQGAGFHQIGSDQGLLAAPVPVTRVLLAPAERADLLIDFAPWQGKTVHLLNAAMEIVEFRVGSSNTRSAGLPTALRPVPRTMESQAVLTRTITLNEFQDKMSNPMVMLLNRKHWHEPVTETPKLNTTRSGVRQPDRGYAPDAPAPGAVSTAGPAYLDTYQYLMYKNLKFMAPAIPPDASEAGGRIRSNVRRG